MTDNPVKPNDPNLVIECYNALGFDWVNQWFVITAVNDRFLQVFYYNFVFGLPILEYVRDFTFAYITPLEFFYPLVAGCE